MNFAKGTIQRFAGTGKKGFTGDGGPATDATFDGPKEIDIDKAGNVFVVDTENETIRRIDGKTRVITTVAGKGRTKSPGQGNGGPATSARSAGRTASPSAVTARFTSVTRSAT